MKGTTTNSARDPAPDRASPYEIVALAASAGGIRALARVLAAFDADFPAAILILLHLDPSHPSHLATILGRPSRIPIEEARDGVRIVAGHGYVGPPDHHLLVNPDGTISLTKTEFVHFVRPSADLLFESVAASYGERAIAVVLTGSGVDGASGVSAIHARGGVVLVQDEASSEFFGMPSAAIGTGDVDRVLPLDAIGPAIQTLVAGPVTA